MSRSGALTGRVALVTGASRGIGAAIAERFAAEGAAVALCARTVDPGSSHLPGSLAEVEARIAARGGRACVVAADLADPDLDRARLLAEVAGALGSVDVLVNNAAACWYLPIERNSQRRLRIAYEVNVVSPYLLIQAFVAERRATGAPGWVLNVTSGIADPITDLEAGTRLGATRFHSNYAPSKAALNRLTQGLALELRADAIAVNALAPEAAVRTEGADAVLELPDELCEPVEAFVEAALDLCSGDPTRDTGMVTRSLRHLRSRGITPRTLDGVDPLPSW